MYFKGVIKVVSPNQYLGFSIELICGQTGQSSILLLFKAQNSLVRISRMLKANQESKQHFFFMESYNIDNSGSTSPLLQKIWVQRIRQHLPRLKYLHLLSTLQDFFSYTAKKAFHVHFKNSETLKKMNLSAFHTQTQILITETM